MTIFIISETLTAGGAEWFSLRLARALQEEGNKVFFFVLRPDLVNEGLKSKFPDLPLITLPLPRVRVLVFLDRFINKIAGKYMLVEWANVKLLKKYIARHSPDVIHGHLIESDLVAIKANDAPQAHNVTTVHGDYIGALKANKRISEISRLLKQLSGIAVISDEQATILKEYYPDAASKIRKIYNGYPLPDKDFKDPDDTFFCFGMIARAVPEKGWKPLMDAFSLIKNEQVRLLLYGSGPYLDELNEANRDERIIFRGFTNDPLSAISEMHVGLLPSYFTSESLPTTVIEYMALGKPVIATNVGEIKNMILAEDGQSAGILVEEIDTRAMIKPLYDAMTKMLEDKEFYLQKKSVSRKAFEKFSMDKCINAYLKLYKN